MLLDDVHGHIEKNNGIKHLVFDSTNKKQRSVKNYTKLWEGTKRQIEVINDDELNTEKTSWKLSFNQTMTCSWVKYLILLAW